MSFDCQLFGNSRRQHRFDVDTWHQTLLCSLSYLSIPAIYTTLLADRYSRIPRNISFNDAVEPCFVYRLRLGIDCGGITAAMAESARDKERSRSKVKAARKTTADSPPAGLMNTEEARPLDHPNNG